MKVFSDQRSGKKLVQCDSPYNRGYLMFTSKEKSLSIPNRYLKAVANIGLLKANRDQTDKSLEAERNKADHEVLDVKCIIERTSDEQIRKGRKVADKQRLTERKRADQIRQARLASAPNNREVENKTAESRLERERKISDKALQTERRLTDTVTSRERIETHKDKLQPFLSERTLTDKNLSEERAEVDSQNERTSKIYIEKEAAHAATQSELTTSDEFLAIVSHDLRNPLSSISMSAQIMKTLPCYRDPDQGAKKFIDMIERNSSEALRMIGDLMDLNRITNGKLGLTVSRQDIVEAANSTIETMKFQAQSKKIAVSFDAPFQSLHVHFDRDRIVQVLSNLLSNAIKFSDPGKKVTLNAVKNELSVRISVCDNGPGIPEDKLESVFLKQMQLQNLDRRGLGLGLYISRMIVEEHLGRIWVESKVGEGSQFHFTLPIQAEVST